MPLLSVIRSTCTNTEKYSRHKDAWNKNPNPLKIMEHQELSTKLL